mmetsp:Transcript_28058/g.95632  ORF Transcript_28058/g.95632 Transcript_28058/m.95632 type:complete len:203 (-) Transcript_28058:352-960(-)
MYTSVCSMQAYTRVPPGWGPAHGPSIPVPKNSACMALTAVSPSFMSTTIAMLVLDAPWLIIFTTISCFSKALNTLCMSSELLSWPLQMSEITAWPVVTSTLAILPKSALSLSSSPLLRSRLNSFAESRVRDTDTSEVATTSTDISLSCITSNTLARKPYCPSMRVDTMSSSVTLRLSTIDVSSVSSPRSRSRRITVPGADVL